MPNNIDTKLDSHQPHHSLLDQVYYELSIFIGMFIMVFGVLLASSSMVNSNERDQSSRSFTEAASLKAESQIVSGISKLGEDYFFELGYTGDSQIIANLFSNFVGIGSKDQIEMTPVYTAERELMENEGVVLGAKSNSADQ